MDLKAEKLELVRLLLDTNNEKLLKKVKALLSQDMANETDYLLASEANKKRLEEGIKQVQEGKTTTIAIEDLWK